MFADHTRSLACHCFYLIRQLRSVRRTLTSDAIIALVISWFDYCDSAMRSGWSVYDIHLRQLQGVLNAAARSIARRRKFEKKCTTSFTGCQSGNMLTLKCAVFNCLRHLASS